MPTRTAPVTADSNHIFSNRNQLILALIFSAPKVSLQFENIHLVRSLTFIALTTCSYTSRPGWKNWRPQKSNVTVKQRIVHPSITLKGTHTHECTQAHQFLTAHVKRKMSHARARLFNTCTRGLLTRRLCGRANCTFILPTDPYKISVTCLSRKVSAMVFDSKLCSHSQTVGSECWQKTERYANWHRCQTNYLTQQKP